VFAVALDEAGRLLADALDARGGDVRVGPKDRRTGARPGARLVVAAGLGRHHVRGDHERGPVGIADERPGRGECVGTGAAGRAEVAGAEVAGGPESIGDGGREAVLGVEVADRRREDGTEVARVDAGPFDGVGRGLARHRDVVLVARGHGALAPAAPALLFGDVRPVDAIQRDVPRDPVDHGHPRPLPLARSVLCGCIRVHCRPRRA